jgi:hypothetical protein
MIVPTEALPILQAIAPVFTRPTFQRFVLLMGPPCSGSAPGGAPWPICGLVRWRDPPGRLRQAHRTLVQSGGRAGADPLGGRPRPRRYAPGRGLLQHRRNARPGADHRDLYHAVKHRDHLSRTPGSPGFGDDPGMVAPDRPADGPVPVQAGHGRGVARPGVARGEAGWWCALAGQRGRHVLRRTDGGAAVVVAGVGFPRGGAGPGRGKTRAAAARSAGCFTALHPQHSHKALCISGA